MDRRKENRNEFHVCHFIHHVHPNLPDTAAKGYVRMLVDATSPTFSLILQRTSSWRRQIYSTKYGIWWRRLCSRVSSTITPGCSPMRYATIPASGSTVTTNEAIHAGTRCPTSMFTNSRYSSSSLDRPAEASEKIFSRTEPGTWSLCDNLSPCHREDTRVSLLRSFRKRDRATVLRFHFPRCTLSLVASCVSRGLAQSQQGRRAVARSQNQVRRISQSLPSRRRITGDWLNGLQPWKMIGSFFFFSFDYESLIVLSWKVGAKMKFRRHF